MAQADVRYGNFQGKFVAKKELPANLTFVIATFIKPKGYLTEKLYKKPGGTEP
ncbi:hypothetical protein LJR231_003906 [Phyllobacterium sp. LjRoot231]|uniref:hypothetical protein n=1 Tax=Phyllobacterium sp. LjRoot231 TaxID=3342289 RepID=UPI003ECD6643